MLLMMNCARNPMAPEPTDPNVIFWQNHVELLAPARAQMEADRALLINVDSVRSLMWRFQYVSEIQPFLPTIETVYARNLCGDCQTAAVLGKWALECIGIEASLTMLKGEGRQPHMITLSNDHRLFISNRDVVWLPETGWENSILKSFTPPYETIVVHRNDR